MNNDIAPDTTAVEDSKSAGITYFYFALSLFFLQKYIIAMVFKYFA